MGSQHLLAAASSAWTVEKIAAVTATYDTGELFGNKFMVNFELRYTPGKGRMIEPPLLNWHEKFVMVDHVEKTRWEFEKNMYELNPHSQTLKVWNYRYICAYDHAENSKLPWCSSVSPSQSFVKLQDLQREPVSIKELGKATTDGEKADAVRKYLQKKGGYLLVSIVDIPSLRLPIAAEVTHKDRLLLFDIGLIGNSKIRAKGFQRITIDSTKPKERWTRKCEASESSVRDLPLPEGFKNVPPPEPVTRPRDKLMAEGKYL